MTAAATTGTANAIIARGLTKRFGATTAVDGIDLDIQEDTVFGLLGPNGAGKPVYGQAASRLSGHIRRLRARTRVSAGHVR
jgi:ABC-type branched-subunit amino acid transport system ATPase component